MKTIGYPNLTVRETAPVLCLGAATTVRTTPCHSFIALPQLPRKDTAFMVQSEYSFLTKLDL